MAQHNIEDATVYARYLKEHPAEVQTLVAYREAESPQMQALLLGDLPVRWDLPDWECDRLLAVVDAALTLRHAPIADCARYDNLRRPI